MVIGRILLGKLLRPFSIIFLTLFFIVICSRRSQSVLSVIDIGTIDVDFGRSYIRTRLVRIRLFGHIVLWIWAREIIILNLFILWIYMVIISTRRFFGWTLLTIIFRPILLLLCGRILARRNFNTTILILLVIIVSITTRSKHLVLKLLIAIVGFIGSIAYKRLVEKIIFIFCWKSENIFIILVFFLTFFIIFFLIVIL